MAIDSSLKHNSAGVYTLIIDKSQSAADNTVEPTRQRLLIGFSKQGPVNRPVLVNNYTDFVKLFGDIDRSLEKSGSYFHRMAKMALNKSSILVMNLLKVDEVEDQVQTTGLSVSPEVNNSAICTIPLVGTYDTSIFWIPDSETYGYSLSRFLPDNGIMHENHIDKQILNMVNINKKPVSVLVKRASEYNRQGYNMTVKDWYGSDEIPSFLNPTSIISDYLVDVYIVAGDFGKAYNQSTKIRTITGDNREQYYTIANKDKENPYYRFTSDITYQNYFTEDGFKRKADPNDTTDTNLKKFLNLNSVSVLASYTGSLIPNFINKLGVNIWIQKLINDDTNYTGVICYENTELIEDVNITEDGTIIENIDLIGHNLAKYVDNEEESEQMNSFSFLSYDVNGLNESKMFEPIEAFSFSNISLNPNEILVDKDTDVKVGDYFVSKVGSKDGVNRLTRVYSVNIIPVNPEHESSEGTISYKKIICYDQLLIAEDKEESYSCVLKVKTIDELCDILQWKCLHGFSLNASHIPGRGIDGNKSLNEQQNNILEVLSPDSTTTNLYKALTDKNIIQFRYLVDTFGNGIEPEAKSIFTKICQKRISFGILNGPSIKEFKSMNYPNPVFRTSNGAISSEYISKGGNPQLAANFRYSLPTEEQGASFSAYFYPYVTIMDNGIEKTVPPAAAVSNLYYAKGDFPWYIVAGADLGVLGDGIIGTESTITEDNRDWLEPFGFNSIIHTDKYNAMIYGNVTAKQTPKSSLSSCHCTDTLIYIVYTIEGILQRYVFGTYHNDENTRTEIKSLVDAFLENVKKAGGIYDYKTVMNKSNNTDELIDANTGVIDVGLELVKGLEKINNRVTVYRTGVISSLSSGE